MVLIGFLASVYSYSVYADNGDVSIELPANKYTCVNIRN